MFLGLDCKLLKLPWAEDLPHPLGECYIIRHRRNSFASQIMLGERGINTKRQVPLEHSYGAPTTCHDRALVGLSYAYVGLSLCWHDSLLAGKLCHSGWVPGIDFSAVRER